ncbi:MAG: hypothetical protein A2Y57_00985 [Candidatus Woykebacteria bacterium RBG_13_40_7b]|uniref:N-acetyltransferase domain-containing protein n=1 Tax=Candidatus Woykebacteria bacterium RBG_13_40_7b TaxID=1802594 RepID=A0A1G1WB58_9BACT|nr:MAG: hypothetical protein A2Y57_00985 [Candidatus Woykebacteria bacterium RBG_13_40_7b]
MIKISKTTNKDVKEFDDQEWDKADLVHYGKIGDWRKRKIVLKAEENERIVGSLKMVIVAGVAKVETIIVVEGKRGEGIGHQLMTEAEKTAKKRNCHKIYLSTGKGWDSIPFYESLGYKKIAELPKHYLKRDFIEFYKLI